jgi:hypothetical protein
MSGCESQKGGIIFFAMSSVFRPFFLVEKNLGNGAETDAMSRLGGKQSEDENADG